MTRRIVLSLLVAMTLALFAGTGSARAEERAYGRNWGNQYNMHDYERFYHYPYVYYPQNFWGNDYYRSSESLYYRYPQEMRIPVYNKQWHNYYPEERRWHHGHQFELDVF